MIYRISEYGAVGNGKADDTLAIQAAIDECAEAGGGRVLFEGGHIYRSGTLILRSHVEFYLESGAVLKASDRLEDFGRVTGVKAAPEGLKEPTYENCDYSGLPKLYFLYAKDGEDIAVTGHGTIDGNEEIFYGTVTKWHIDGSFYPRVPLFFMENIRHLTVKGVTLTHSAFWTVHLVGCEDVLIDGIRILNNMRLANSDGIDPDHCKNVRITNCHIECADDCIVLKNTSGAQKYGNCENIVVTGCTLMSTSAAVKFGTESESLFQNIVVSNCAILRSNRGISMQLRDKGNIRNVIFSNLTIETRLFSPLYWWGKAEPIAVTALRRREDTALGSIRNITFENILCRGEGGILIYGEESGHIGDIFLKNITVELEKRTDWEKGIRDLRPCVGNTILNGKLEGIYVHNAEGIEREQIRIRADEAMKEYM